MNGNAKGKWSDFLSKGERIISEFSFSGYDIAATNKRLICLKKFPKSFSEARYSDIFSLGHYTPYNWNRFIRGVIFIAIAGYLYTLSPLAGKTVLVDILKNFAGNYLSELPSPPFDEIVLLAILVVVGYGLQNLLKFIQSTKGVLKITLRDKSPIKISTSLTSDVTKFIQTVESLRTEMTKTGAEQSVGAQAEGEATVTESTQMMYENVSAGFSGLPNESIVLVSSKSDDMSTVIPALLKILLVDRKENGIYISLSSPFEQISKIMKNNGIPTDNIVFIDCISHMAGKSTSKEGNTVFVENPSSLEEIGMYADKVLVRMPPPKFVLLDSVSSLLIYNNDKSVKEFIHFMINKMRLDNMGGVILATEKKEADELVRTLTPMCDKKLSL